jgi:hypothetical protein
MVKADQKLFYAVRVGAQLGIFTSWRSAKPHVHKFPKAVYRSFPTLEEAERYMKPAAVPADPTTVIYTDGSCKKSVAGAGIWFGDNDPRNASVPVPGLQTNQRAEVFAVGEALRRSQGPVEIKTDSLYAINGCTRSHAVVKRADMGDD